MASAAERAVLVSREGRGGFAVAVATSERQRSGPGVAALLGPPQPSSGWRAAPHGWPRAAVRPFPAPGSPCGAEALGGGRPLTAAGAAAPAGPQGRAWVPGPGLRCRAALRPAAARQALASSRLPFSCCGVSALVCGPRAGVAVTPLLAPAWVCPGTGRYREQPCLR